MPTKDKLTKKNNTNKKLAKEQVKSKPVTEITQTSQPEPVATVSEQKPDSNSRKEKLPLKLFGFDVKKLGVVGLLVAFIGALPTIIGLISDTLSILDRLPVVSTPTLAYVLTSIVPVPQPTDPMSGVPLPDDPTTPASISAKALTPLEFHGNEFTAKQVQCMTPTVIPISGAYNAVFFPGGQALAVQIGDGESQIGIWDLQKNSLQDTLIPGILLTQSSYGPLYLVYDYDETYVILAKDGSTIYTVPNDEQPYGFAVSHDGRKMAFGYENGQTIIWDITTGESFTLFASRLIITHIEFSADDSLIATGSDQSLIYIWDAATHSMKASIDEHTPSFSFSPNGQEVLYIGYSSDFSARNVYNYQIANGDVTEWVGVQDYWSNGENASLFFSADQSVFVSGGTFWRTPENSLLRNLKEHTKQSGYMVAGSFEGDKLVSASIDEIIVWDLTCSSATQPQPTVQAKFEPIVKQNLGHLKLAQTFEDAELGYFASKSDRFVMGKKVYSLNTMKPVADFTKDVNFRQSGVGLGISPDGKFLVSWDYEDALNVWDVDNVLLLPDLEGCSSDTTFLPDGRLLAISSKDQICIWDDLYAPPKISKMQGNYGSPSASGEGFGYSNIIALPSGVYQVVRSYNGERKYALVDLFSGDQTPKYIFPDKLTWEVMSSQGTYAASICEIKFTTCIYRIADQALLFDLDDHASPYAFSADEKLFAVYIYSNDQNKIQVYDTDTWQLQTEIDPLVNYSVDALRFTPDGHYLAIGEANKTWFWSVDGK